MNFKLANVLLICLAIAFILSCGDRENNQSPVNLSYKMFVREANWPNEPLMVQEIVRPDTALSADEISGQISFAGGKINTNGSSEFVTGLPFDYLPSFEVQVYSEGDRIIPVSNEFITERVSNSFWQVIFGEGRSWQEQEDNGFSRGQLTVTLINPFYANAHNGLLTFLYKDGEITDGWIQVFQENVSWLKQDFYGGLELNFSNLEPSYFTEHRERLSAANNHSISIESFSSLEQTIDSSILENFSSGIPDTNISAAGIYYDGVVYNKPLMTRYGVFPYPSAMRHGVYSIAKSMAAAIAVLHLNQKYDGDLINSNIQLFLNGLELHEGWDEVKVGDLLSMSTGTGSAHPEQRDGFPFADETFEETSLLTQFFLARTSESKLNVVQQFGNYNWGVGEVFRYNTSYTFLLSYVLQNYLVSKGEERSLWAVLQQDVFEKLGIINFPMAHTEGSINTRLPLLGVGIYPTVEEAVKISKLFMDNGLWNEEVLLDQFYVESLMNFNVSTGLPVTYENDLNISRRYHLSFWSEDISQIVQCEKIVPYMFGWGNNYLIFPGNQTVVYRFQDAFNSNKESLLELSNELEPLCQ